MELEAGNGLWMPSPARPVLGAEEVHVWRARLHEATPDVGGMERILSAEENDKAKRFRFTAHRREFIVRHAVLRIILARYLDADPADMRFSFGPHGKPALADGSGKGLLSFNMSHSAGIALYAVTQNREVGVDVEWCLQDVDCLGVARRFFTPREAETLSALPRKQRASAFFRLWTRKEAWLKAVGWGLFLRMNGREGTLLSAINGGRAGMFLPSAAGSRAIPEEIAEDESAARWWSCMELAPSDNYIAAVVAEGSSWKVRRWMDTFSCAAPYGVPKATNQPAGERIRAPLVL